MKEKIAKIILNNLNDIYCYNCKYQYINNICECCHRKSMCWSLSNEYADSIANEIVKECGIS